MRERRQQTRAMARPLPLVGRGAGVGGGSACETSDRAYRPTAPLTLPSPHKGERGAQLHIQGLVQ
jgi:hypothetical protein